MIAPLMRAIAYVSNLTSRSGSYRSIAPIRPSNPYETRSPSSTCAGSPDPRRPATYFTSGAYVRINLSRIALSPLLTRNCRHRVWVSSASATRRGYGLFRPYPGPAVVGQPALADGMCVRRPPGRSPRGLSAAPPSRRLPQGSVGHRGEPDGERDRGERDHPAGAGVPGPVRRRERDPGEADREQREQRAERTSLLHGWRKVENPTATILATLGA